MGRWSVVCIVAMMSVVAAGCDSNKESYAGEEASLCTIHALRSLYRGYPLLITDNIAFDGVVCSSDRYGEMRSKVALQDHTGGIMVLVDYNKLYTLHSPGDRLRVECRGLMLGGYGNSVRLGGEGYDDEEVGRLSLAEWNNHHRTVGVADQLDCSSRHIGELTSRDIATLTVIEEVRFVEAGESWGRADTTLTRHLVDIRRSEDTLRVRIAPRADFIDEPIPAGECRVRGVVDYFHDEFRLIVDSPDAVLPVVKF